MKTILLAISLLCGPAYAMTWDTSIDNGTVYFDISKKTPRFAREAFVQAVTQWNNVSGNPIVLVEVQRGNENLAKVHLAWCSKKGSYPKEFSGTFALTSRSLGPDGHMASANIYVNAEEFRWPNVKWSLFEILGHEVGHALGLQHAGAKIGDLMYFQELTGFGPRVRDEEALKVLYGGN